jgi:light-regulated signal transduction histidine kinase (bacteriophytochrome)
MIHNIANQDTARLTDCEQEPIHIPGSIQPFGFFLGVKYSSLTIEYCSANTADFTGSTPEGLLGTTLAVLLPEADIAALQAYLFSGEDGLLHPLTITLESISFNVHAKLQGDLLLLEFEPKPEEETTLPALYRQMQHFVSGTESACSLQHLCQLIAADIRSITGFNRVMIYRFDEAYNGEVFAESKADELEPFLNLHYPHSDIPPQARQLYLTNLIRLIGDVHYEPVPLLTLHAAAGNESVNLGAAVLRSVSPIHIQYLKNMGVRASFSISLVHEGRLWGLIACHHYTGAKVLPYHTRLAAQLQGHFLTSQIRVQEAKDAFERTQAAAVHLQFLQRALVTGEDFVPQYHGNFHLQQLTGAGGVLIVQDDKYYTSGQVPEEAALRSFVAWLAAHTNAGHLYTDSLITLYPKAKELGSKAAGVLYHSLGASEHNCIIWFRPEVRQEVNWGGNMEEEMLRKQNSFTRLSPRGSFALWQEEVRHKSIAWDNVTLSAAASFAYSLQKQFHLTLLARDEARYRRLTEQLTEANEELSKINWISTHDLKEPLRKIQMFGSRILESEKDSLSELVASSVTRIRLAAARMQALVDDLLLYSKMNVKEKDLIPVSLEAVAAAVVEEHKEKLTATGGTITIYDLPVVKGVRLQLDRLFRNILSNAIKFAREHVPPNVTLRCEIVPNTDVAPLSDAPAARYYRIDIADNGIGFEPVYAKRIFEIFQRLHTTTNYSGTGIGLAICRRIMLNHNGAIAASGEEGLGATFHLYFPVSE